MITTLEKKDISNYLKFFRGLMFFIMTSCLLFIMIITQGKDLSIVGSIFIFALTAFSFVLYTKKHDSDWCIFADLIVLFLLVFVSLALKELASVDVFYIHFTSFCVIAQTLSLVLSLSKIMKEFGL